MPNDATLSPVQNFFQNKWVRLILIIDVFAVIILIGIFIWQSTKVSTVKFNIAPLDATISINGDKKYGNGQYSITPGTYKITISHEGLETKTFDAEISPKQVTSITTFLSDDNKNFDFYKLRANYMSYKKLEEIASSDNNITTDQDTSAESFIKKFQEDYNKYITKLPIDHYKSEGYGQTLKIHENITFRTKNDCEYTLCIEALVAGTDDKIYINSLLEEKGFNTEDFEIEYKMY